MRRGKARHNGGQGGKDSLAGRQTQVRDEKGTSLLTDVKARALQRDLARQRCVEVLNNDYRYDMIATANGQDERVSVLEVVICRDVPCGWCSIDTVFHDSCGCIV